MEGGREEERKKEGGGERKREREREANRSISPHLLKRHYNAIYM